MKLRKKGREKKTDKSLSLRTIRFYRNGTVGEFRLTYGLAVEEGKNANY